MIKIAPSILSADFANLERDIRRVSSADWLHVDVMDGCFVPNLTIGVPVVQSIRKCTGMFLDVHLMIDKPGRYVEAFAQAGADLLSVHLEADHPTGIAEALRRMEACKVKKAVALRPITSANAILPYIEELDMVLEMTVEEALPFFENLPRIYNRLKTLEEVGLGYVKLGQASTTLSGGEAQRVKLATELSKRSTGRTIYILDEPTPGLHSYDVQRLIEVLQKLVDVGNTVVVIEHNLDVIKTADHIIDLGPEGGDGGGAIVCTGTPEEVAACGASYTGRYLKRMLE